MTRNRKIQSPLVHFGYVVKVLVVFAFVVGAGVGYIWQENQNRALAQKKKECEQTLVKLQRNNKMQRNKLDTLRSPMALELRIKELDLGLVQPQPEQIVRLPEPLGESLHPSLVAGPFRIARAELFWQKDSPGKEMLR